MTMRTAIEVTTPLAGSMVLLLSTAAKGMIGCQVTHTLQP